MSKATKTSECPFCHETIKVGDEIAWSGKGFCCAACKPKGKARVADTASIVAHSPVTKAVKGLIIAAVTLATGWLTVKAESFAEGRDNRDVDMVRYEKILEEQHAVIVDQGQRIAFLEGRFAQRDSWTRSTQPRPLSDVKATEAEVKAYQETKK